jgi:hypothetical protein
MKFKCLFLGIFYVSVSFAQWKSISKNELYLVAPFRQFILNPYKNQLWFVADTKVSTLNENGSVQYFDSNNLGELWTGDNISFVFTPNDIYYNIDVFGLHKFTNYVSTPLETSLYNYFSLSSNGDTIYVTKKDSQGFVKYYDNEQNKNLIFLSNNFTLSALEIAMLYKHRWENELFFKSIKQHLTIKLSGVLLKMQ